MWKIGDVANVIECAFLEIDGRITKCDNYYGSELMTAEVEQDYKNNSMIVSIESTPLNDGECPEEERLEHSVEKFRITVEVI